MIFWIVVAALSLIFGSLSFSLMVLHSINNQQENHLQYWEEQQAQRIMSSTRTDK